MTTIEGETGGSSTAAQGSSCFPAFLPFLLPLSFFFLSLPAAHPHPHCPPPLQHHHHHHHTSAQTLATLSSRLRPDTQRGTAAIWIHSSRLFASAVPILSSLFAPQVVTHVSTPQEASPRPRRSFPHISEVFIRSLLLSTFDPLCPAQHLALCYLPRRRHKEVPTGALVE